VKAAFYERQGDASDVLTVGDVPTPDPAPGEVRVRIYVSGLNPTDTKARSGFSGPMAFPKIVPHQDGAGVIDAVGDGVSVSRIGERVWIYEAQYRRATGTAAEFVVVPEANAVSLPDHVSFETGASLGIAALTAHRCLFADGDIKGRRVLVHGGAGAVGTAAILLAKWAGAWVVATITREVQRDIAFAAGADLVLNIREDDVAGALKDATHDQGVDRIVEVNVSANLALDLAVLAPSGVISAYATQKASDVLELPILKAMVAGAVFRFVFVYTVPADAKRAAVDAVAACIASGVYRPHVGLEVPLDEIAKAHQVQDDGSVIGKILVKVADEPRGA